MLIKTINPLANCQLKFSSSEKGVFEGYAAKYNTNDAVNDTILPGAFDESLALGEKVKMFFNHQHGEVPVGDWNLRSDDHGLHAIGKIDLNHKDGPTLYSALLRGAVDGLSQGFTLGKNDYTMKEGFDDEWFGGNRNIKNLNLKEISLCNFPCETQARVTAVKSDVDLLNSLKDFEAYFRDVCGFSKSMAKAMISQLKHVIRRDAEKNEGQIIVHSNAEVLEALKAIRNRL